MALKLEFLAFPEPDGGEELAPVTSLPGARMKKLREVEDVSPKGNLTLFWVQAVASPELIAEVIDETVGEAERLEKAGEKIFPAFDAAQFRFFAILGALTGVVQNTSLAFGVKPFEGPGGVLLKKVKDLSQEYEDGDSITFSAQVQGDFTSKA